MPCIDMDQIINELEEAAEYEGTECSQTWISLCDLWRHQDALSYNFIHALEEEIRHQYKWFKNNFTWVKHSAIQCDKCGTSFSAYKDLVYHGEW